MKIARSLPSFIVFITVLSSSFARLAEAAVVALNDFAIHDDYTLFASADNGVSEVANDPLITPFSSTAPVIIAQTQTPAQFIKSSAGESTSISICEGDALSFSATLTPTGAGFEFYRIRGRETDIVRTNSPNPVYNVTDYLDGDAYFVRIYDYNNGGFIYTSDTVSLTVLSIPSGSSPFEANTIVPDNQIVCIAELPATLTTTGSVLDTDTSYIFQWEQSLDNGVTFDPIPGATTPRLFFSQGVTMTTIYRRSTQLAAGGSCIKYSNEHLITVLENEPGDIATSGQTTICYGDIPPLLENSEGATINTGNLDYRWEVSFDTLNWDTVGGNTPQYQPTEPATQTLHYRRVSVQTGNAVPCEKFTNIITVNVLKQIPLGTLSTPTPICFEDIPAAITYSLNLDPDLTYQWEQSTDGINFTPITGQTQQQLTFTAGAPYLPAETTYYRITIEQQDSGGTLCVTHTASVIQEVFPLLTELSTDAPNDTICAGEEVTVTAQGDNTYQFIVNGLIQNDAGTNTLTLTGLTRTTTVTVRAINSGCEQDHSILINVLELDPGRIDLTVNDCSQGNYIIQSQTPAVMNQNNIIDEGGSYQWELSFDGKSTWQTIIGASSETLVIGSTYVFTPPVHYRRIAQANGCTEVSNDVYLAEIPSLNGGNSVPERQIICGRVTPSITTLTINDGSETSQVSNLVTYQWEISTDNGTNYSDIIGQTSPTLVIGNITQTTFYRREVSWINDPSCPAYSTPHRIFVLDNDPGSIGTISTVLCYNDIPPPINSLTPASVTTGTFQYQWEISYDGISWTDLGHGGSSYVPTSASTQTHYYRRLSVPSLLSGCTSYTSVVTVTINNEINIGTITRTQSILNGEIPTPLVYDQPLDPLNTYQWEQSLDGINFTPIANQNAGTLVFTTQSSFTPTQTTSYRLRLSRIENGKNCTALTNTVNVLVDIGLPVIEIDPPSRRICQGESVRVIATGNTRFDFFVDGVLQTGVISDVLILNNLSESVTVTVEAVDFAETYNYRITVDQLEPGTIAHVFNCEDGENVLAFASQASGTINGSNIAVLGIDYSWETSTDGMNWIVVNGATDSDLKLIDPDYPVFIRRSITYEPTAGLSCKKSTNIIQINTPQNFLTSSDRIEPGEITAVSNCAGTEEQLTIISLDNGSRNGVDLVVQGTPYRWETSSDSINWTVVNGEIDSGLQLMNPTYPLYIRRIVPYEPFAGTHCSESSNSVVLFEAPPVLRGGTATPSVLWKCRDTSAIQLEIENGTENNDVIFQWESSLDSGNTFTAIAGQNNPSLILDTVTQTTHYRRRVRWRNPATCEETSNVIQVNILDLQPGSIASGDPIICYGDATPIISSIAPASVTSGTLSYQWESSDDGILWTTVSGQTGAHLISNNTPLYKTQYFRRKSIQNANGIECEKYTAVASITVLDEIQVGSIGPNQDICLGNRPEAISYSLAFQPEFTYQWESSSDGQLFIPISGAQNSVFPIDTDASLTPTQTTYYRLAINNRSVNSNCTQYTNTATISVLVDSSFDLMYSGSHIFCLEPSLTFTASGTGTFSFYVDGILAQGPSLEKTFTIDNPQNDVTVTLLKESNNSCPPNQISVTRYYHNLNPGEIAGPEFVCNLDQNSLIQSVQEATINNQPLSNDTTDYLYQWQSSLDGVHYTDILGANTADYQYSISLLTTDTHFRRLLKSTLTGGQCERSSNSIFVQLTEAIPTPNAVQVSSSVCHSAILASYTNGTPPYKSELFDANRNLIASGSTTDSQTFTNLNTGQFYILRITDSSCSQPREVSIEVPFEISFDPNKVSLIHDSCYEQTTSIGQGSILVAADAFTGGSNDFDYHWSGPNGFVALGPEIQGLVPGTYHLTIVDRQLGCHQTESFIITGATPMAATFNPFNLSLDQNGNYQLNCQASTSPTLMVQATGGHGSYTYAWRKNGVLIAANQTSILDNITEGAYEVIITDVPPGGIPQNNPCQLRIPFTVQAPLPLTLQIDRTAINKASCQTPTIDIPVTIAGGVTPYIISINGLNSITTYHNTYTFTNINPSSLGGTLVATVMDQSHCTAETAPIPIEEGIQYSFTSSVSLIDCQNGKLGAIQLLLTNSTSVTETLQLEWQGDSIHVFDTWAQGNGQLNNLDNPGSYTVTVTNSSGCIIHTETFDLQDNSAEKLSVQIVQQTNAAGCGEANGGIQLEISGGYPPLTIQWEQLSDTNSWTHLPEWDNNAHISGLDSGTFRAIVSDASSGVNDALCSKAITTRNISIDEVLLSLTPFSVVSNYDPCQIDKDGQIKFKIQNSLNISNTLTFTYTIDGATVAENSVDLTQSDWVTISGINPGEHQLTVKATSDNFDCSVTKDFTIATSAAPIQYSGPLVYLPTECNLPPLIEIQASDITGGTPFSTDPPYALEWLFTPLDPDAVSYTLFGWSIENAKPGVYQLQISDANGCQNDPESPIEISVETLDIESFSTTGIFTSQNSETTKVIHAQCNNNNKGSIGIQIHGGLKPFNIKWYALSTTSLNDPQSTNGPTELTQYRNQTYINELDAGSYRVEIESNNDSCDDQTSPYRTYSEIFTIQRNTDLHVISGPYIENSICEGKPGRITLEIFDNNQGALFFYYNGKLIQTEDQEQVNEQTFTLLIEDPVEEAILAILNEKGCQISKTIKTELGEPKFSFSSASYRLTKTVLAREEITFQNNTIGAYTQSEWIFGDYSDPILLSRTATDSTVSYSYPTSGAYPVTLRIYNKYGCSKEYTQIVPVGKGYSINAPNVFTPNDDGINDRFRPFVTGFQSVLFSIYDSRGNILYTETVEEPNLENVQGLELVGWDGNNAPDEEYFIYRVEGTLVNSQKTIEKTGTFILLK